MQDNQELVREVQRTNTQTTASFARIQGEFVRKSLHLLIAVVPVLAAANLPATLALLAFGTLFYAFAESSRRHGNPILVVSDLTVIASRERDQAGFVLGPVTLGLGAMISLLLYPDPAASIAIYALAFGDGLAALVGRAIGGPKIPLLQGKTFSGSFACFAAVFAIAFSLSHRPAESLVIAAVATVLEGIPTGNFDNIIIPFGVGMVATKLLVP
ncbi:MAG TPA: phosphatidate cytidylyltransferase [Spirochaetia bacterium]|nr:phosphatidate cytidylyltransferase [Spirochaetia bacterium]